MLLLAGWAGDASTAHARLDSLLQDGSSLAKFAEWVNAQGGDSRIVDDVSLLPQAPIVSELPAAARGFVTAIDAREIGLLVGALGAGRERKGDPVDPAVGVVLDVKVGDRIMAGQPLATVYARNDASLAAAQARLVSAIRIGSERVEPPPTIYEILRG